ncbi:MAG TPA: TrmH family RNA methyltransferase, partial [Limnobacter sp.]|nr:TrmH family RNA methyltransferase [Limnobacter sp.]
MKLGLVNLRRIDSPANERVKHLAKLVGNASAMKAQGVACAEGLHLFADLMTRLASQVLEVWLPDTLLDNPEWVAMHSLTCDPGTRFCVVPAAVYKKISALNTPTGPLAVFAPPNETSKPDFSKHMVVLDGIQDPGNVGVVLRNAAAAGIEQVVCTKQSAWVWGDKAL